MTSKKTARPIRIAVRSLALACTLVAIQPALAKQAPAADLGDWTLAVSEDARGCFLTRQYDGVGKTTLLLGLDIDGKNRLTVLNDNWSIKPGERLKLDFRLSKGGYPKQVAIGLASDGKKGFVTAFEARFLTYFATSEALAIARGTVPVDYLALAGSGAAVVALRSCVDTQRVDPDNAPTTKKRPGLIPKDPFARR